MYILSKHRELSKQINIHEIAEKFRRNLASNPPILFFQNKKKKSCNPWKRRRRTEESNPSMKQGHA
jgi:hypothetical protein